MRALKIKPESAYPLYCQLYDQLRQAILEQRLPAGTRLPSTRTLARTLGVSRNTGLMSEAGKLQLGFDFGGTDHSFPIF